ncbi:YtfJ family protein [Corallincola platygyrae]|uniref:YtfJ family protein n=1 Tax=Corallincola platygyrae TaxID=1193278 RepID=A0ABW4XQM1_9GAMM
MRVIQRVLGIALLLCSTSSTALTVGVTPPKVDVSNKGLMALQGSEIEYQDWSSQQLTGKARVVVHIAAKKSANEINQDAIQALTQANLPITYFQTTTIVNASDRVWGTQKFIRNLLEERTAAEPNAQFVLDNKGRVRTGWGLKKGDSAIFVFDGNGSLLWYKEGRLDILDIEAMMQKINNEIARLSAGNAD